MNLLIEHIEPQIANLREQQVSGDVFLSGIFAQSCVKNGNGRIYALDEISKVVELASSKIAEGHIIPGELGHPDLLTINLSNVSHVITEMKMDGNNAVGKMKLLNTPAGNIAKNLIAGGLRLGVSTRGTGNVNENGNVTDFSMITIDVVHQPSAPGAYPDVVQEALENKKIQSLAEAVVEDKKAQAYFKKEIENFIKKMCQGNTK